MRNIVLTGFMGSGKTSVGLKLSEILNINFIDTDSLIIKKFNMPIEDIFKIYGERRFREVEEEVIKEISENQDLIISTGGGVVLNKNNIEYLRKNGIIYYLHTSPEVVFERIKDDTSRPLLQNKDKLKTIINLMNFRIPFYKNCDYEVNTDNMKIEEIVDKILNIHLKKETTR
ncbi:shikimate kinase [Caldicellulosiruptoraceae bacterium PP1]